MKIKYVGDNFTQFTEVFGEVFELGNPKSIDHMPEAHQTTLMGNPMFVVVSDDADADAAQVVIDPDKGVVTGAQANDGVEIPDGWDQLDFMSLKALARKIDPAVANDATKDACVETVEAELGRRAAKAAG